MIAKEISLIRARKEYNIVSREAVELFNDSCFGSNFDKIDTSYLFNKAFNAIPRRTYKRINDLCARLKDDSNTENKDKLIIRYKLSIYKNLLVSIEKITNKLLKV